jgi:hypothetical protein
MRSRTDATEGDDPEEPNDPASGVFGALGEHGFVDERWRSRGGDEKSAISNPPAIAARVHRLVRRGCYRGLTSRTPNDAMARCGLASANFCTDPIYIVVELRS